ncbi:MAG: 5-formyltetrahydrofolate cyclo-ligase [Pelagibacterales bacterium]|jgi:5-formyltetrahydrofolate cyclo-ligase|nr:5-formyltetrahydrofolate cyclo-ligase [Pelagibacterales bacterium]|tara:strand:+ start:347 stop:904 length:558 start_codon:yes stop_codon:yes gene_type:complete
MLSKELLREKFFYVRKKKYLEVNKSFFLRLNKLIEKIKKKKINLSFYYPSNYEVNTLNLFKVLNLNKINTLLPVIVGKNKMKFIKWTLKDPLKVNKYGMLEPFNTKKYIIPHVALVPLLAFDKNNHRLGYGKGYYDNFLTKYLKSNKNILTIGIAFSFQKYNKLPSSNFDVKLNYILTEKSIQKL